MTEQEKIICDIYRSPKKDQLYLYVPKTIGLKDVPEALLSMFGRPQFAFTMLLTPEKKLVKEDAAKVMAVLQEQGYFLQLPPVNNDDDYMLDIARHNSKLSQS